MHIITGKTKLLGIIGDPVEHSLSPVMHNCAIESLGMDYVYIPFPVKKNNLKNAIAGFGAIDLVGFNITIPHKQAIIPFLSEVSSIAQKVGAVNTVWGTEKGWYGTNTDVTGFIAPLKNYDLNWKNITPVILGNGGAARAVIVGLIELGCSKVHVVGRNPQKLAQFAQSWQHIPEISSVLKIHYWDGLKELLPSVDLLVNTTPLGMYPNINDCPLESELIAKVPKNAIAYDLIYTPRPTLFLSLLKERGVTAIDGLEMLVRQGAAGLETWLNCSVPIDVMRNALEKQLLK